MKKIIGLSAIVTLFFGWDRIGNFTNHFKSSDSSQHEQVVTANDTKSSFSQATQKIESLVNLDKYEAALDEIDALMSDSGFSLREMDALKIIREDIINVDTLNFNSGFSIDTIKQKLTVTVEELLTSLNK